jgi:hypothetical protein
VNPQSDVAAIAERVLLLVQREVALRQAARQLEMDATGDAVIAEEARRLIARANGVRKVRLARLARCGLSL